VVPASLFLTLALQSGYRRSQPTCIPFPGVTDRAGRASKHAGQRQRPDLLCAVPAAGGITGEVLAAPGEYFQRDQVRHGRDRNGQAGQHFETVGIRYDFVLDS
jgi:hypothetical protein